MHPIVSKWFHQLEKNYVPQGGLAERMYHARKNYRDT